MYSDVIVLTGGHILMFSSIIRYILLVLAALVLIASCAPMATPTVTFAPMQICGELTSETELINPTVKSPFTPQNSGLKGKSVRTITMGRNGLWIGYAGGVGVGFFDGQYWRHCQTTPHVNAISLDQNGLPWVGTDAPPNGPALLYFNGTKWLNHTAQLPDYRVYELVWHNNQLNIGTLNDVGRYDSKTNAWDVPYRVGVNLFNSRVHAIAFAKNGDIWFGHHADGISWYEAKTNQWFHLGSDNIREIVEHPMRPEIWIASDPGKITIYNYHLKIWTTLDVPNKEVNDIDFDKYGLTWIATKGGVFVQNQNGAAWKTLSEAPSYSIAFGCADCVFNEDIVFVGTVDHGLIQGVVPPANFNVGGDQPTSPQPAPQETATPR